MGILRTDKISGLETPKAVTGSVVFDGSGDYLQITPDEDFAFADNDFTIETWAYFNTVSSGSGQIYEGRPSGTQGAYISLYFSADNTFSFYTDSDVRISATGIVASRWYHIALVRNSGTTTLYLDGISQGTYSDSQSYLVRTDGLIIGVARNESNNPLDGYLSNYRILKGTALYTSDFTPPVHELEVIGDTVLLCCNNPDSAAAASYAGIGTSKTITVNGNAAASTFSPGLTKDFTYGTEFRGVTTFDTQGYFVPPSGTTEQRGRGRGVFSAGTTPNDNTSTNTIDYITIATLGNSQDFGDTTESLHAGSSGSDSTRGLFSGGAVAGNNTNYNTISYITIATTSNAVNFGDLSGLKRYSGSTSDKTRTVIAGGKNHPGPTFTTIEYVTTQALGDAQTFGDLSTGTWAFTGTASSPTRGIYFGGSPGGSSDSINTIVYVTIQSLGDAQDFGDLTNVNSYTGPGGIVSSTTRGIRGGGGGADPFTRVNTIDYVTMATLGNAQDFGDLSYSANGVMGCSSLTRGIFAGGKTGSGSVNTIEYVTIASTGNAQDFGDMRGTYAFSSALSDSHGGLS